MDIAIVIFEGFTSLDVMGPYEVLGRLPDAKLSFVGAEAGPKRADQGPLILTAERALKEMPKPDLILVPGGPGQEDAMRDERVLSWLREANASARWTTSVCTGSLVLAAAGLLEGRGATTHWLALDRLARLGALATPERVVLDGKLVTAAGVSAGIDMALTLVSLIAGEQFAQAVQLGIEYDPQPPFDAGSPQRAPQAIVDALRGASRHVTRGA